jgi:Rieske Fe-S protein
MSDAGAPDPDRRTVITWLWRIPVLAVLGGAGYGLYEAINVHFLKRSPARNPVFEDAAEVEVGRLAAFAGAWDSIEFTLTTATAAVPAVAIRLPGPVQGGLDVAELNLIAFSRICTHQHCLVSLNTDVNAITFGFNYDTTAPALTCSCHLSVFDPQRAGRAVSGPANLPLPRVRLAARGDMVVATGLETA